MLAIYVLFWAFSVFLVLPFGVRTSEEAGARQRSPSPVSLPQAFDRLRQGHVQFAHVRR